MCLMPVALGAEGGPEVLVGLDMAPGSLLDALFQELGQLGLCLLGHAAAVSSGGSGQAHFCQS